VIAKASSRSRADAESIISSVDRSVVVGDAMVDTPLVHYRSSTITRCCPCGSPAHAGPTPSVGGILVRGANGMVCGQRCGVSLLGRRW